MESPSFANTETGTIVNEEETIVSSTSASQTWKTVVKESLNEIGMLHQLKHFVKDTSFPHVKFLTHKSELFGDTKPQSIAQFVVRGLNVDGNEETR